MHNSAAQDTVYILLHHYTQVFEFILHEHAYLCVLQILF
jgi:hypothetical protein